MTRTNPFAGRYSSAAATTPHRTERVLPWEHSEPSDLWVAKPVARLSCRIWGQADALRIRSDATLPTVGSGWSGPWAGDPALGNPVTAPGCQRPSGLNCSLLADRVPQTSMLSLYSAPLVSCGGSQAPQKRYLNCRCNGVARIRLTIDCADSQILLRLRTIIPDDMEVIEVRHAGSEASDPEIRVEVQGASAAEGLTLRQVEILQLVSEGYGNKEIAGRIGRSVKTVEFHRGRIMERLGLHSAVDLTRFAAQHGLIRR